MSRLVIKCGTGEVEKIFMNNEPHDHHYVPQFYLRSFSVDPDQKKVATVAKHGRFAVWAERSIESLGYERDLYVHFRGGIPVSVESGINRAIETPISQSETWAKIVSGRTDALDRSDKPILYALIRHLHARTPHALTTMRELSDLSASPDSDIPFTDQEREMNAQLRGNPGLANAMFNLMASSLDWTVEAYRGAGLSIWRSPIPLRSSTTPVLAMGAPAHPALRLPLPGMTPYQLIVALNRTTLVTLVLADFDDAFSNIEIDAQIARGISRQLAGQFAYFPTIRHLITGRDDLIADMTWAPYELIEETARKITFRKKES
jgi:hypothetical protein